MATLTHQELESHLWKAADILRGSIDSGDYKHYIFGLLFFKRLSDVWEEEYEDRLKELEDEKLARDPEEHRFHIPSGSFWKDIKKKSTNIGERLNSAFRKIEDENLRLKGVFQDVDFNNKDRFPDSILEKLIQHFDKYSLRKSAVPADMLGNAYEYLIAKFADDAGATGGEFYTPKEVVRLIVEVLQPQNNESIYDPTCGSAGMLLEAFHFMERNKRNPKSLQIAGQEKNLNTWAISQMNLFLHDIDDASVLRGDTLLDPKHLEKSNAKRIKQFDIVLANPPFSLKNWGYEVWQSGDPFGRDAYGCPPKSYADFAFFQHMLSSLNSKGRMAVVLPLGVLFREGPEKKIRVGIVDSDAVEAIVALPPNLFYGAVIPTCLFFINKNKSAKRKNQILMIDASNLYRQELNRNVLSEEHILKIVSNFRGYNEEVGFSKIVKLDEVINNDYVLNFGLYVSKPTQFQDDLEHVINGTIPDEVYAIVRNKYQEKVLEKILSNEKPYRFLKEYLSVNDLRRSLSSLQPEESEEFIALYQKYGISFKAVDKHFKNQISIIENIIKSFKNDK
ncbi:MAG: type I restriction-modification system subunit M [Proteobacteria bacterium]|nr:MAG: type I restriction-modification system subunit M [Pseudomonadota bacterium]